MSAATVNPERLAAFEAGTLAHGGHDSIEQGACAMEWVSYLADEGFTDAPECASPVLRRYLIALNDRWDDEKRQSLKPFLVRTIGTAGDGLDEAREKIAAEWASTRLVAPWLRLAGLDEQATKLEAATTVHEVRHALHVARAAAWNLRNEKREALRVKVRFHLEEQLKKKHADAVAAAAADAVADAVAVAVAAADAVAVAVAVAVAAADAAAVAVAAAVAAAAAVADAVAAAAADAAAAAAADAAAVAAAAAAAAAAGPYVDWWGKPYSAAYQAARAYYKEHPLPITQTIADLAAEQQGAALELLELLIDPTNAKEAA
jgi:hypothetical protein